MEAAASAAPKVASRYLIQDDSAGAGVGAAARSSSLTSFGSTVATPLARAGAVGASPAAATGTPALEGVGATGQAVMAGAGFSVRWASAGAAVTAAGATAAESTACSCFSGLAALAREGARAASRSLFGRGFSS